MYLHILHNACFLGSYCISNMQHAPRDSELFRVCDCVIIHYRMESVSLDVYIAHVSPGVVYGER